MVSPRLLSICFSNIATYCVTGICKTGCAHFRAITIFEWAFIYTDAHYEKGEKDILTNIECLLPAIGSWFRYQHMLHLCWYANLSVEWQWDWHLLIFLKNPGMQNLVIFPCETLSKCFCCRGWNLISRVEIPNTLPSVLVGAAHGRAAGRGGAGQTRMPTGCVAKKTKVLQAYQSIVDSCPKTNLM